MNNLFVQFLLNIFIVYIHLHALVIIIAMNYYIYVNVYMCQLVENNRSFCQFFIFEYFSFIIIHSHNPSQTKNLRKNSIFFCFF